MVWFMTQQKDNSILLTCAEMAAADKYTIDHGTPGITLMERAGRGVARVAEAVWREQSCKGVVLILCGPGNNGGDGYVAAKRLAMQGIEVRIVQLGAKSKLRGDAAAMRDKWPGEVGTLKSASLEGVSLVLDGLFGSGLNKAIEGIAATLIEKINTSSIPVISIDVPSGLSGDSGNADGVVFKAAHTVTFHAKKVGHLLYPGKALSGQLHVVDIGINPECYKSIQIKTYENISALWWDDYPQDKYDQHKYHRGHVLILGSKVPALGASRLAALAALRTGSGLVTLMAPSETYDIQAGALEDVMVVNMATRKVFLNRLKDERITAVAMGPGAGVGLDSKKLVLKVLTSERPTVIDADALTSFADNPKALFDAIKGPVVLTPHSGEFQRLFPDLDYGGNKVAVARTAAKRSSAVIALKGPDTVIASPCGRACINSQSSVHLSVGGTGDVLTGMVVALLGRGMPAFEAASAAVWLHSRAGDSCSVGMIASDLVNQIPSAREKLAKNGPK